MRCALSCGLFRTFACGSFRSWTFSPLPQSVPRKNPNYICDPSARGGGEIIFGRTNGTFGTSATCGTQMRRDRKFFFSVLIRTHPYSSVLTGTALCFYKSYKSYKSYVFQSIKASVTGKIADNILFSAGCCRYNADPHNSGRVFSARGIPVRR